MEHAGSQCRVGMPQGEGIAEMLLGTCAATGDDRYAKVGSQTGYMMQIYLSPFGPASTTPPPAPATTPMKAIFVFIFCLS